MNTTRLILNTTKFNAFRYDKNHNRNGPQYVSDAQLFFTEEHVILFHCGKKRKTYTYDVLNVTSNSTEYIILSSLNDNIKYHIKQGNDMIPMSDYVKIKKIFYLNVPTADLTKYIKERQADIRASIQRKAKAPRSKQTETTMLLTEPIWFAKKAPIEEEELKNSTKQSKATPSAEKGANTKIPVQRADAADAPPPSSKQPYTRKNKTSFIIPTAILVVLAAAAATTVKRKAILKYYFAKDIQSYRADQTTSLPFYKWYVHKYYPHNKKKPLYYDILVNQLKSISVKRNQNNPKRPTHRTDKSTTSSNKATQKKQKRIEPQ